MRPARRGGAALEPQGRVVSLSERREPRLELAWGLGALLLVLSIYGRALGHGFVHDDHALLEHSQRLADWAQLPEALRRDLFWLADGAVRPSPYWRPLVVLTYYVDRELGDGAAGPFHLSNLLYLSIFVYLTTMDLPARARAAAMALLVAHPMMSEVALNITARTDLLAALFGWLAVRATGVGAALITLLALGCKEVAVVIPALALGGAWLEGDRSTRRWLPQALAVGIWLVVRGSLVAGWGVAPEDRGLPTAQSALDAAARVWFYLDRLVWPIHPVAALQLPDVPSWAAALAWVGLVGGGAFVARDAPRALAAEALRVVAPLLPVSGLLASPVRYADGFLCWPLVGLARALAGAAPRLTLALAVPCALISFTRAQDWRDEASLWASAREDFPEDPLIAGKFGVANAATDPAAAEAALRQGVEGVADARLRREWGAHLANVLVAQDRWREALPWLRAAALPDDPEASWALMTRCTVEAGERLPPEPGAPSLAAVCAEATRRSPRDPDLWNARGVDAASRAELEEARRCFEAAVALAPEREDLRRNLELARALLAGPQGP